MSRGAHADVIAELAKDSFNMAHLIKLDFTTPIYITESATAITHGGISYLSSNALKSISNINETAQVQAGSITINLSSVSQEYVALLLSEQYIGNQVEISRVLLTDDHVIIGDPILLFDGSMQSFTITDGTNSSSIALIASSHWSDFDKKSGRRTNSNSQNLHFPNDRGMEFSSTAVQDVKWGKA